MCRVEEPGSLGQFCKPLFEASRVRKPNLPILISGRDLNPAWVNIALVNALSAEAARTPNYAGILHFKGPSGRVSVFLAQNKSGRDIPPALSLVARATSGEARQRVVGAGLSPSDCPNSLKRVS
jgi:hypothetical protein